MRFCREYDGSDSEASDNPSDYLLMQSITSHGQVVILRQTNPEQFVIALLDLATLQDQPDTPEVVFDVYSKRVVIGSGDTSEVVFGAADKNKNEVFIHRTRTGSVLQYGEEINNLSDISTLEAQVRAAINPRPLGRIASRAEIDSFTRL